MKAKTQISCKVKCTADQRLCFRYKDGTSPLLHISKLSSFYAASMTVQAGLCKTWSETKIGWFSHERLKVLTASHSCQCNIMSKELSKRNDHTRVTVVKLHPRASLVYTVTDSPWAGQGAPSSALCTWFRVS